jgi:hypothetical protein
LVLFGGLVHVARTGRGVRLIARLPQGGEKDRDQQRDDRDDHQDLDQCETM